MNWIKIKNEYITGNISYRKLAEKHGVSFNTLKEKAINEKWSNQKKSFHHKTTTNTQQKTAEKIVEKEVNRIERLYNLSDQLNDKIEEAIHQLDIVIVTNRKRIREIEYKDANAKGKPTKEIITDLEEAQEITSIIDRQGLQQIANALKAVKDIQTTMTDSTKAIEDIPVIIDDLKTKE